MTGMKKRRPGRRRLTTTSYPVPSPDAVEAMQREIFSGRFADRHLSALLARASQAISEEFHEDVRRHRMPINEWRVLASLCDAGGLSLAEVGDLTLIRQPTLTRLVQRLEHQGLIRKTPDADDRRMLRLSLTRRGYERVGDLISLAEERQKRILQGLDAGALEAALRYLIAFCAAKRRRPRARRRSGAGA